MESQEEQLFQFDHSVYLPVSGSGDVEGVEGGGVGVSSGAAGDIDDSSSATIDTDSAALCRAGGSASASGGDEVGQAPREQFE